MPLRDSNTSRAGTFPQQAAIEDGGYPDLRIKDNLLDSTDEITYHEDHKVYRLEYDQSVDTPSVAVVAAVATMTRRDPVDLDPLYSAIDPSALDDLFTATDHRPWGRVVFQFNGFEIMASSRGVIEVNPR